MTLQAMTLDGRRIHLSQTLDGRRYELVADPRPPVKLDMIFADALADCGLMMPDTSTRWICSCGITFSKGEGQSWLAAHNLHKARMLVDKLQAENP